MRKQLIEICLFEGKLYMGGSKAGEYSSHKELKLNAIPLTLPANLYYYHYSYDDFIKTVTRNAPKNANAFMMSLPTYNGKSYVEREQVAITWYKLGRKN